MPTPSIPDEMPKDDAFPIDETPSNKDLETQINNIFGKFAEEIHSIEGLEKFPTRVLSDKTLHKAIVIYDPDISLRKVEEHSSTSHQDPDGYDTSMVTTLRAFRLGDHLPVTYKRPISPSAQVDTLVEINYGLGGMASYDSGEIKTLTPYPNPLTIRAGALNDIVADVHRELVLTLDTIKDRAGSNLPEDVDTQFAALCEKLEGDLKAAVMGQEEGFVKTRKASFEEYRDFLDSQLDNPDMPTRAYVMEIHAKDSSGYVERNFYLSSKIPLLADITAPILPEDFLLCDEDYEKFVKFKNDNITQKQINDQENIALEAQKKSYPWLFAKPEFKIGRKEFLSSGTINGGENGENTPETVFYAFGRSRRGDRVTLELARASEHPIEETTIDTLQSKLVETPGGYDEAPLIHSLIEFGIDADDFNDYMKRLNELSKVGCGNWAWAQISFQKSEGKKQITLSVESTSGENLLWPTPDLRIPLNEYFTSEGDYIPEKTKGRKQLEMLDRISKIRELVKSPEGSFFTGLSYNLDELSGSLVSVGGEVYVLTSEYALVTPNFNNSSAVRYLESKAGLSEWESKFRSLKSRALLPDKSHSAGDGVVNFFQDRLHKIDLCVEVDRQKASLESTQDAYLNELSGNNPQLRENILEVAVSRLERDILLHLESIPPEEVPAFIENHIGREKLKSIAEILKLGPSI